MSHPPPRPESRKQEQAKTRRRLLRPGPPPRWECAMPQWHGTNCCTRQECAEPVGALSRPLRDIAAHAEIRAVRPNDEHSAVAQARVMDRRAKVHGELAADAVRRRVRKDNGPDAVILLKSDRRHFGHSHHRVPFGSARYRRERAFAVGKWGTPTAL